MKLLDIDYNQTPKLIINDVEYSFNQTINAKDHIFNNAGSSMTIKDVFPIDYTTEDLYNKPVILPKYSLAEFYYGNSLFYFGIVKRQQKGTLNPFKLKKIDITISTLKEFLINSPMDFIIVNKTPEFVIDKIIQSLNIPYVVKGKVSFNNKNKINAYNTKDMTAYDVLRFIERFTNSTLEISFDSINKQITINYFTIESIISASNGNKGIDIPFDTQNNIEAFCNAYGIIDVDYTQDENKNKNVIRVESDKSLSQKSRKIEIDLSNNQTSIALTDVIGNIDGTLTKFIDENGVVIRKLSIATQKQVDEGRPWDIIFSPNSNSLTLNERLFRQNPNGKLIVSYFPLTRQNIDFENSLDQKEIADRLKVPNGKLFGYEKYNDITNLDDLIANAKSLLELGIASKIQLKIVSREPIWDLGQHTNFISNEDYKDFEGEYIVTESKIRLVNDETGGKLKEFSYLLSDIKHVENTLNHFDPQTYRDNPLIRTEDISLDISKTISEQITLESTNLVKSCGTYNIDELDKELDLDLESELIGQENKILKI